MMSPMKVTHTATYDAPVDDVYAMLVDPAFREYLAREVGVLEAAVTIEPRGSGHVVTVDQVQPNDGLPSFARTFAGETTRAVQTETWTGPTSGTLVVRTPGRPTDLAGTYTLTEGGGRTTQTFEGEIKVKVPLIKDRLERLMTQLFLEGKDREQAAAAAWLAGAGR